MTKNGFMATALRARLSARGQVQASWIRSRIKLDYTRVLDTHLAFTIQSRVMMMHVQCFVSMDVKIKSLRNTNNTRDWCRGAGGSPAVSAAHSSSAVLASADPRLLTTSVNFLLCALLIFSLVIDLSLRVVARLTREQVRIDIIHNSEYRLYKALADLFR